MRLSSLYCVLVCSMSGAPRDDDDVILPGAGPAVAPAQHPTGVVAVNIPYSGRGGHAQGSSPLEGFSPLQPGSLGMSLGVGSVGGLYGSSPMSYLVRRQPTVPSSLKLSRQVSALQAALRAVWPPTQTADPPLDLPLAASSSFLAELPGHVLPLAVGIHAGWGGI